MARGEDQQPVGAFAADAQDPPFGCGIGFRGLGRGAQYVDAGGGEDGVEGVGEFGVPVTDEEAELLCAFIQVHEQVAGLLGDPCAGRMAGGAQDVDAAAGDLHHEEDVDPLEEDGVDGEEIAREDTGRLGS